MEGGSSAGQESSGTADDEPVTEDTVKEIIDEMKEGSVDLDKAFDEVPPVPESETSVCQDLQVDVDRAYADAAPITKESLLADNQWMMRCCAALGSGGIYKITPILEKYGVRSIHQIGDNAEVLAAVKAEIANLFPQGEVPR